MSHCKPRSKMNFLPWATLPMARPAGLESRLRSLLAADRRCVRLRRTVSSAVVCSMVAACVALSVFRLRDASATEPTQSAAPQVPSPATPAQSPLDYTKTLPGGVHVSLAELWTTNGGGEKPGSNRLPIYWKPDGTRLLKPQFGDWRSAPTVSHIGPVHKWIGSDTHLSFLFTGLGVDQTVSILRIGGNTAATSSTRLDDGRVVCNYAYEPDGGQREDAFEVGVTSGRPIVDVRVALVHLNPSNRTDPDMKALAAGRPQPNFARIYKSDSGSPASSRILFGKPGTFQVLFGTSGTSSDANNVNRKIAVLDKNGNAISPRSESTTREPNYIYKIILLSPADARRAAFIVNQTRILSLVTIDHVALKPKGSA